MKYQKQKIIKKYFIVHSIQMSKPLKDLGLSSEELKEVAVLLAKKEILKVIKVCLKVNYQVPLLHQNQQKR